MILGRLIWREEELVRSRVCKLVSVFKSKNVQSLHSFSVTPDRYFSSSFRNLFVLRACHIQQCGAVFVNYVACIRVVCLEVVGPNL